MRRHIDYCRDMSKLTHIEILDIYRVPPRLPVENLRVRHADGSFSKSSRRPIIVIAAGARPLVRL
jgi:hypothetical protein